MRRRRSFLFIALKAVGNLSLAWGMKHFPHVMSANPISFIQAMFDPFVAIMRKVCDWGVVRFARNSSFLERR